MNKVDKAIQLTMLQYPERFLTRWSVLFEMFFVSGAGSTWNDKGCLVNVFEKSGPNYKAAVSGKMNVSGVEEKIARINQSISEYPPLQKSYQPALKELAFELAGLRHRAANIVRFSQQHLADPRDYDLAEFDKVWLDGTAISSAPYDQLHKDWAQALDETAHIVYARMKKAFGLGENPLVKDVPKKWQPLFRVVRDVQRQLAERNLVKAPGRLAIASHSA